MLDDHMCECGHLTHWHGVPTLGGTDGSLRGPCTHPKCYSQNKALRKCSGYKRRQPTNTSAPS